MNNVNFIEKFDPEVTRSEYYEQARCLLHMVTLVKDGQNTGYVTMMNGRKAPDTVLLREIWSKTKTISEHASRKFNISDLKIDPENQCDYEMKYALSDWMKQLK